MTNTRTTRWLAVLRISALALVILSFLTPSASRAEAAKATVYMRPHCSTDKKPPCPTFDAVSPDTLKTPLLQKGGTLDIDIVATNPNKLRITSSRTWLFYNSTVLQGTLINLGTTLNLPTPGESTFSSKDGFVKIEASAKSGKEPIDEEIVVARVQFKIINVPLTSNDILSFFDIKPNGHTTIMARVESSTDPVDILEQKPGVLLLSFDPAGTSSTSSAPASSSLSSATFVPATPPTALKPAASSSVSSVMSSISSISSISSTSSSNPSTFICGNGIKEDGEECDDGNFINGDGCNIYCAREIASSAGSSRTSSLQSSLADGAVCSAKEECRSGLCSRGICRGEILKVEDGGACNNSDQCFGRNCENSICTTREGGISSSAPSSTSSSGATRTNFSSLQVRNLRITTEGPSVFLTWEPLVSSQLKAYNVYYGSTSGRYIQRMTVTGDSTSINIRSLPANTRYFFAVRAVNAANEESAFSQEVAIVVGKPTTSTAPLTGNVIAKKIEAKVIEKVQGETGLPVVLTALLIAAAVIGTLYASRRQIIALSSPPPKP